MAAKRAGCKDASNALVLCCVALCWQFLPAVVDENVKLLGGLAVWCAVGMLGLKSLASRGCCAHSQWAMVTQKPRARTLPSRSPPNTRLRRFYALPVRFILLWTRDGRLLPCGGLLICSVDDE